MCLFQFTFSWMPLLLFALVTAEGFALIETFTYLIKDVSSSLMCFGALCISASRPRCGHTPGCVRRTGLPHSDQTYSSSSSDDICKAPDRLRSAFGVSLLNEISAAFTRALVFPPFARGTGVTSDLWICEQPPSSFK